MDLLFEAEARGLDPVQLAHQRGPAAHPPISPYALELVEGVSAHRTLIDEALSSYAHGWALDRMPAVDRALLRIASYEVVWGDEVPDAVAIDEALELARELSTDDSPPFINGLLSKVLSLKEDLRTA